MIRPIQRLPSILLLLERLLKYTSRTHIDHQLLMDSLDKLREIAKKLNEERGKTEKHLSMFNIVNSIDNCPVSMIQCVTLDNDTCVTSAGTVGCASRLSGTFSSHRTITRIDQ
jgi:hypothetical protein